MDPRTRSIIIGAFTIIILVTISATIIYLGRISRETIKSQTSSEQSLSRLPVVTASPVAPTGTGAMPGGLKSYPGPTFSLRYPVSWGLLTCRNSQNFELDPTKSADTKRVVCDLAIKPVTFLVSTDPLNCSGETTTLGANRVIKSKTTAETGFIRYEWCLSVGGKNLDITHRVSQTPSQATSKEDFSAAVEEVIKTIKVNPGTPE